MNLFISDSGLSELNTSLLFAWC